MDYKNVFNYALHGFEQPIRATLIDILKCKEPVIKEGSSESFLGFSYTKGQYLLHEDTLEMILCFDKYLQKKEKLEGELHPAHVRMICDSYFMHINYEKEKGVYAAANRKSEQLCGIRLFSNPDDIRTCAKEHFELLRIISNIEANEMFGSFDEFDPLKAKKVNGAIDWNWYRWKYEEKLINRTISGEYNVGDLISFGTCPFEYDGTPSHVKWIVLEKSNNTALLMSLYSFGTVQLSKEELQSKDTVTTVLDSLYEKYYRLLFDVYPEDSRIVPFDDGRRISLLTVNDIQRLGWDDNIYETAIPFPYHSGVSNRHESDRPWLVLGYNDEQKNNVLYKRDHYRTKELYPSDWGTFNLRPVIKINCHKVSESHI